jgi:hypothetical protein
MTGADRIPIDSFGGDPLAAAPLDGLVDADQQRTRRHEGRDPEAQQHATDREAGPARPVQDPMVALKAPGVREAHHPQRRRHRPIPGSEQGADDEHDGGRPDAAAEQWRERRQQG